MRVLAAMSAVLMAGLLVSGCDWTSSGQSGGWSSSYEAMNFSGVYRGRNGGPVLSGTGGAGESERSVSGEQIASGNGSASVYNGQVANRPIVPGSLVVAYSGARNQTFSDNGNGALTGSSGGTGSVDYNSGLISIDADEVLPAGLAIRAYYRYRQTLPSADPGQLMTLNVTHTGQRLEILTSTGILFKGQFGGISSSGIRQDNLEDVVAEFTAKAHHGGRDLRMVGVFQTTLTHYYDTTTDDEGNQERQSSWFSTSARVINATWTTSGSSSTLDIYAEAPSQEQRQTN